jgi:hypothetical protein
MGRGSYEGVHVQVNQPSWLVLAESYNRGWRATCDGRSLGSPSVVDGFGNGWRVSPGCSRVSITFAPQKAVNWGYVIGGLACALLLLLMVVRRPRRPERPTPVSQRDLVIDDRTWRLPGRRALLVGVAAALVFGFVFALRAGLAIGPVAALLLWRGISPRAMILFAAGCLAVVVPALYVIFPATNRGGYGPAYPIERLGPHWVTVGALVFLIFALARTLTTARPFMPRPASTATPPTRDRGAEEAAAPASAARP